MGNGLIIALVIIVIFGLGGYVFYANYYVPKIISENTESVLICSDTDGNNIYEKGYTDYKSEQESQSSSEDYCEYFHPKTESRVGLVKETWCEGNVLKEVLSTCGWGYICRNGACIQGNKDSPICSDTDGGKDSSKRGWVSGYGGTGIDDCWVSASDDKADGGYSDECEEEIVKLGRCYVYEYFCDSPDMKGYEIIKCQKGCLNGACL